MKDQKNQSYTAYEQYPGRVWDNALQNIQEVYHKNQKLSVMFILKDRCL